MTVAPELAQLSHPHLVKVHRCKLCRRSSFSQVIGIIREPGCCVAELVPGGESSFLRLRVALIFRLPPSLASMDVLRLIVL
jgi:hypothetical protein